MNWLTYKFPLIKNSNVNIKSILNDTKSPDSRYKVYEVILHHLFLILNINEAKTSIKYRNQIKVAKS